jgi:hypothetical protein
MQQLQQLGDFGGPVFRDDAHGVAGGVFHAGLERQLDVAGLFF